MSPRLRLLLISMAALLGVACTLALGRWQLNRADQKEQLQASIEAQGKLAVLNNVALQNHGSLEGLIHRSILLRGQWLTERTIYLDNRQMNGKPGLFVLTPLRLDEVEVGQGNTSEEKVVMVQRGWIPRNFVDRSQLPRVLTPSGPVAIEGRIAPPPSKLYELGEADQSTIRQNIDLAEFSRETGLLLLPLTVQQTGPVSGADGLLRNWPVANTGVDKHYGYAFQWFGLSALIAILYVWFQIVRRFFPKRQA